MSDRLPWVGSCRVGRLAIMRRPWRDSTARCAREGRACQPPPSSHVRRSRVYGPDRAQRPIVGSPRRLGGCCRGAGRPDGCVCVGVGLAGGCVGGVSCERLPPRSALSRSASRSHRSRAIRSCGRGPRGSTSQSAGPVGSVPAAGGRGRIRGVVLGAGSGSRRGVSRGSHRRRRAVRLGAGQIRDRHLGGRGRAAGPVERGADAGVPLAVLGDPLRVAAMRSSSVPSSAEVLAGEVHAVAVDRAGVADVGLLFGLRPVAGERRGAVDGRALRREAVHRVGRAARRRRASRRRARRAGGPGRSRPAAARRRARGAAGSACRVSGSTDSTIAIWPFSTRLGRGPPGLRGEGVGGVADRDHVAGSEQVVAVDRADRLLARARRRRAACCCASSLTRSTSVLGPWTISAD